MDVHNITTFSKTIYNCVFFVMVVLFLWVSCEGERFNLVRFPHLPFTAPDRIHISVRGLLRKPTFWRANYCPLTRYDPSSGITAIADESVQNLPSGS